MSTRNVPGAVVDMLVEFLEDGHLHVGWNASVVLCNPINKHKLMLEEREAVKSSSSKHAL
jgi:hypothetical protein